MSKKIDRALTERIQAIPVDLKDNEDSFKVIGTRKLSYDVHFSEQHISCTCPDFQMRAQICKHIYYLVYHYYHIKKENILSDIDSYTLQAFKQKRSQYDVPDIKVRMDNCSICHDTIEEAFDVAVCVDGCLKPLHNECFSIYNEYMAKIGKSTTCPSCRKVMAPSPMVM